MVKNKKKAHHSESRFNFSIFVTKLVTVFAFYQSHVGQFKNLAGRRFLSPEFGYDSEIYS